VPQEILSLMSYPQVPSTRANASYWNQIELVFSRPASGASLAHAARTVRPSAAALAAHPLSAAQWDQLMTRVAALPFPTVASKPSSAAVRDPKRR
jgi:hypothetical protein